MEATSRFNNHDFEVWVDHFQYLDIGERHQSVPSGKSYLRGTFDPDQDAYVIEKIHIDPDMLRTDVKEDLLDEAKLQAHKRNKKLLRKRVAAMPKTHEPRMRIERTRPEKKRMMITRDLQGTVYKIGNALGFALMEPQGSSPGDARWRVSGLSRSTWSINHPDIMQEGESPLSLTIRKITSQDGKDIDSDGEDYGEINDWIAIGRNKLTNLSDMTVLARRESPPGGDDWDDIDTFVKTAAEYFHKQKDNIMALKQAMLPQNPPGTGYAAQQPQQAGGGGGPGGDMGGMGGGMMASRRARRRKAVGEMVPAQPGQQQQQQQGATVGGPETAGQVSQKVQGFVSQAVNRANRLTQSISDPRSQVRPDLVIRSVSDMNNLVHGAAVTAQANLGPQAQGLIQKLGNASRYLQAAAMIIHQAGPQVNRQVLAEVQRNLQWFTQTLESMTKRQARRASATLANLRKAQKIARQINRICGGQDWYLGIRVINDRAGIGLGVGAAAPPPRSLKASVGGIPVVLEGPGARALRARQEARKHLRLAQELAQEVAEGLDIDPEAEKELKRHQRLVKRVFNHIKNSARLSGSVRYLARKLGIDFADLVKVIGQLIVEGKIEFTKKKKFKLLPEPHTPIPGMQDRFSSTNSVFGIDRGRSDKRVDQLLSQSVYQLNLGEPADAYHKERDIREVPSKIMPDPTQPN